EAQGVPPLSVRDHYPGGSGGSPTVRSGSLSRRLREFPHCPFVIAIQEAQGVPPLSVRDRYPGGSGGSPTVRS
ncbi:hypothetical protein ABG768_023515, partial [Culter alburnus]